MRRLHVSPAESGMGRIRRATDEDHPGLLAMYTAARAAAGCFEAEELDLEAFRRRIAGEEVHVMQIGDGMAGFVSLWRSERFIHHLYVAPAFQGQGVGTELLRMCDETYGRPLSLKSVIANHHAQRFYRRRGWRAAECGDGPEGRWQRWWLRDRWLDKIRPRRR